MKLISTLPIFLVFSFSPTSALETIDIRVGGHLLTVELADTPELRERGLMYRHNLPANHGMLFVFDEPQFLQFWMKNTFIPLAIGYFDSKFNLIDIQKMQPVKSEMEIPKDRYRSSHEAILALEVNPDWFDRHHIEEKKARLMVMKTPRSQVLKRILPK